MTTLSDVKRYMQSRRRASLSDIAVGLGTTPDNARHLLEMWQAKNKVRLIACADGHGSCGKGASGGCACGTATILADVYEWLGEEAGEDARQRAATDRTA